MKKKKFFLKKQATKEKKISLHVVTMKKFIISLYFYSSFLLHGILLNKIKIVQKIYTT